MDRLARIVDELRHDKKSGQFRSDDQWKVFFSNEEMKTFWMPTEAERADWQRRWLATPVPSRFTDRELQMPWDFGSMLDAIQEGEYSLVGVRSEKQHGCWLP